MLDNDPNFAFISDDDPFWDVYYAIENLIDYWYDDRIDHAFCSYAEWADITIF